MINQLFLCPNLSLSIIIGILSITGAQRNLKLYASPAQLNKVIVLLSIPADLSHSDSVEKISNIGKPDEKPKTSNLMTLISI